MITVTWRGPVDQYAWGYQVRFELTDSDTGRIANGEGVWKSSPTPEQIDEAIATRSAMFAAELNPPAPTPEYIVTCEDGTEVPL